MVQIHIWPYALLKPHQILANVIPFSRTGGVAISGIARSVRTDRGRWAIDYKGVTLHTAEKRRAIQKLAIDLCGRAGLIKIPVWSDDSTPWPAGANNSGEIGGNPSITAEMAALASPGDTIVQIRPLTNITDMAGVRFSFSGALYQTGTPISVVGDVWTVPIAPAIRARIPADAQIDVTRPECICHLTSDVELDVSYTTGNFDQIDIKFIEAADYWADLLAPSYGMLVKTLANATIVATAGPPDPLYIMTAATASEYVSDGSLVLSNVTATVGDMLVLAVAADNNGTGGASSDASVVDSAGNTWTERSENNNTPGSLPGDGTTLTIWTCPVINALVSGTVTLTFVWATMAKVAILKRVVSASFLAAGAGVISETTPISIGPVNVTDGDLIIGFAGFEHDGNPIEDSDTVNGAWSDEVVVMNGGGTSGTSQVLLEQSKLVTATGNQTFDIVVGQSAPRVGAINYIILRAAV